jgi:hypothetical protein
MASRTHLDFSVSGALMNQFQETLAFPFCAKAITEKRRARCVGAVKTDASERG